MCLGCCISLLVVVVVSLVVVVVVVVVATHKPCTNQRLDQMELRKTIKQLQNQKNTVVSMNTLKKHWKNTRLLKRYRTACRAHGGHVQGSATVSNKNAGVLHLRSRCY